MNPLLLFAVGKFAFDRIRGSIQRHRAKKKLTEFLIENGFTEKEAKQMGKLLATLFSLTPGMQSSEFKVTILALLAKWIGPHFGVDFPTEAIYTVVAYVLSRGIAKFNPVLPKQ